MSEVKEFKVIETQEQLNEILKDRLVRKEKSVREEYADFDKYKEAYEKHEAERSDYESKLSEMQKQYEEAQEAISGLNSKITQYEIGSVKTKACVEYGIPLDMAGRLQGENEEEIMKDAAALSSYVTVKTAPPKRNPEAKTEEDGVMAAFKKLNPNISL